MNQPEQPNVSESNDSTVAVDEQPAAAPEAATEAPHTNGTGRPDPTRGFLTELTHVMRGAAERERERISAEVDAATEAHVEKIRGRAATEAAELRRLAEEDIDGIHAWSKEEMVRIREETEQRIGTRREELQSYLIRHAAIIDGEVGHVEGAVREYRSELDRFFERLVAESDPASFARMADEMPDPPDLARVGGSARAEAMVALAEEADASDAAVADAVASVEVNGPVSMSTPFHPEQPGPELVPVMGDANGMANGSATMPDGAGSAEPTGEAAVAVAETEAPAAEAVASEPAPGVTRRPPRRPLPRRPLPRHRLPLRPTRPCVSCARSPHRGPRPRSTRPNRPLRLTRPRLRPRTLRRPDAPGARTGRGALAARGPNPRLTLRRAQVLIAEAASGARFLPWRQETRGIPTSEARSHRS